PPGTVPCAPSPPADRPWRRRRLPGWSWPGRSRAAGADPGPPRRGPGAGRSRPALGPRPLPGAGAARAGDGAGARARLGPRARSRGRRLAAGPRTDHRLAARGRLDLGRAALARQAGALGRLGDLARRGLRRPLVALWPA